MGFSPRVLVHDSRSLRILRGGQNVMFSSGAAMSLVPWWRLTAQSGGVGGPSGFFLSCTQMTPILENQLYRTVHNTLILDPCRNGRNLRVREVRSSILRLALFVRPNGLVVLCFFLFFLPYSNTTAILVGYGGQLGMSRQRSLSATTFAAKLKGKSPNYKRLAAFPSAPTQE